MSRVGAQTPAAAPRRPSATVQRYGPNAAARAPATDSTGSGGGGPVSTSSATRARRSSVPAPAPNANGAASSAASTAAGDSDAAAVAAALPSFPTLDRFLAVKGNNLRQRRLQQLQMEAAYAAASGQPVDALRVDTGHAAPGAVSAPAAPSALLGHAPYPHPQPHPHSYRSFPHPLPHPAYAPQLVHAHMHPQPSYARPPLTYTPDAPGAHRAPGAAAPPIAPSDSEPLSPASVQEMLLIPELQSHLQQLKKQWRKEWEREQRLQPTRRGSRTTMTETTRNAVAADDSDTEPSAPDDGERSSGPRVRFEEDAPEASSSSAAASDENAAALAHAQADLLAEQQAHSATMSRLTQLTSSRMEEHAAMEAERQSSVQRQEELQKQLREAETRADAAQRTLDEERQRHAAQLSSLHSNDALIQSLTSKYESLLDKYTGEKLSASEATAALRAEQTRVARLEADAHDAQRRLNDMREQLRQAEDQLTATQRSHREEAQQWAQQEQQKEAARHTAAAQAEAENERLRSANEQLQSEVQRHVANVHRLESQLHSCESRLREQTLQSDLLLQQSEKDKQEQLRFTESMHANLEQLSRQAESKQQEVRTLEGELRSVLQAFEQLKHKHVSKVKALQSELEARAAEVDDCKVLLKTLMAEEKATRAQRDQVKQQLHHAQQQLQQRDASLARLQSEHASLQSRSSHDASVERVRSLEHELRICNEVQARIAEEKERLAVRLEDAEDKAREVERRHAEERAQLQQAAAEAAAAAGSSRAADPDPELLRSFHDLSDKLSIKEKILESLTEQLSNESRAAASLTAEVKALKKGQAELERSVADMDEARRAAHDELKHLQAEAHEWAQVEAENAELRREIELKNEECERLQKQLTKKCDSLSYIESEVGAMKLLFERKESDALGKLEREQTERRAEAEKARQREAHLEAQVQLLTQQYQDAQNSVHQCEQEMRVLIVQLDKERKQRIQIKQQLQGLMPQL